MSLKAQGSKPHDPEGLDRELYTLEQVSHLLSLSKRKVEDLVSQGLLRSAIVPGTDRARRVSRQMLVEFVADFDGQDSSKHGGNKRR